MKEWKRQKNLKKKKKVRCTGRLHRIYMFCYLLSPVNILWTDIDILSRGDYFLLRQQNPVVPKQSLAKTRGEVAVEFIESIFGFTGELLGLLAFGMQYAGY